MDWFTEWLGFHELPRSTKVDREERLLEDIRILAKQMDLDARAMKRLDTLAGGLLIVVVVIVAVMFVVSGL